VEPKSPLRASQTPLRASPAPASSAGGRHRARSLTTSSPLAPPPCWRHLPPPAIQHRVTETIADIEQEAAARHRAEGGKPLGVASILRQDPHHHPPKISRSPAVLVHAASKRARIELDG